MSDGKPGFFRRFFGGIWAALNFTRRLVLNLIFLCILVFFLSVLFAKAPILQPRTALVVDPKGEIVEQYRSDPESRALSGLFGDEVKEVQLRDLLHVIDTAAKDTNIERIVLLPDEMTGAGLATLTEIGAALERFRASGKEVVAVSNGMTQMQYFLADTPTRCCCIRTARCCCRASAATAATTRI